MKLKDAFPSQWISADDLGGRNHRVVIESVEIEEVGQDREEKLVIAFKGKAKRLICNKTNAASIEEHHGDDTDNWIGKEITLTTGRATYRGKTTDAVRIVPPASAPERQLPPEAEFGDPGAQDDF